MNLSEIRTQFRTLSGRFDLVNSDGTDNGADFFINAGQRYLDRTEYHQKSSAINHIKLASGMWAVGIPLCRAIKEVWWLDPTDGSRTRLTKQDWNDLRAAYGKVYPAVDSGNPLYYTPLITRSAPSIDKINAGDMDALAGSVETLNTNNQAYNGIAVVPPPDQDIYLEIVGYFYSNPLESDTDESYWSQVHPNVLIMGALREVEVFNRNSQGINDWETAIQLEVGGIAKDFVEEMISDVDQMEG